jgi:hypothetical protein
MSFACGATLLLGIRHVVVCSGLEYGACISSAMPCDTLMCYVATDLPNETTIKGAPGVVVNPGMPAPTIAPDAVQCITQLNVILISISSVLAFFFGLFTLAMFADQVRDAALGRTQIDDLKVRFIYLNPLSILVF